MTAVLSLQILVGFFAVMMLVFMGLYVREHYAPPPPPNIRIARINNPSPPAIPTRLDQISGSPLEAISDNNKPPRTEIATSGNIRIHLMPPV